MPSLLALDRTAISVRPSFNPITRVGVLSFANSRSSLMSDCTHGFPLFLVYFGISGFPPHFHDAAACYFLRATRLLAAFADFRLRTIFFFAGLFVVCFIC